MMKNRMIGTGLAIAAAVSLSACQSKRDTMVDEEITTTRVLEPMPQNTPSRTTGPTAGSQADLEQNVGNRVFFGYNEYTLTPEARAVLGRQAAWLQEYPGARIRVEGNADERGTREYNLALGARRANAVRSYLTALGVDPSRVTTVSYGKERPIDPRSTPEAWARNRNAGTVVISTVGA